MLFQYSHSDCLTKTRKDRAAGFCGITLQNNTFQSQPDIAKITGQKDENVDPTQVETAYWEGNAVKLLTRCDSKAFCLRHAGRFK